jgi:threonine dehydratase
MSETATIEHIEAARELVRRHLVETPLVHNREFSEASGNEVFFKLENLQRTHAFKARGALNKVAALTAAERERGVIAASSGNHALGVAYASSLLGGTAVVVMPEAAPPTKVGLAQRYGAKVILHGRTYDDALDHARRLADTRAMTLLPSFDDAKVIAGQATITLEVLEALPDVELILVPIGGGGLISGAALALGEVGHQAALVGVEAEGAACMLASLQAGERVKLPHIETVADGIAVQQPGELNFEVVRRCGPEVVTVDDDQILAAMARLLWDVGIVVEPAAAAAPAALLFHERLRQRGLKVCCVVSGGNVSQALLETIVRRAASPS